MSNVYSMRRRPLINVNLGNFSNFTYVYTNPIKSFCNNPLKKSAKLQVFFIFCNFRPDFEEKLQSAACPSGRISATYIFKKTAVLYVGFRNAAGQTVARSRKQQRPRPGTLLPYFVNSATSTVSAMK